MEVTNLTDISLDSYKDIITDELYNDLLEKVKPFAGKTVVHFNATPIGGGVAELLQGLVPLMRSVGINTRWFVIPSKFESFFKITKKIHNCLQGSASSMLTKEDEKIYMETSKQLAELMKDVQADYWFVHDPQPLGTISYLAQKEQRSDLKAIWRCHIDLADASCKCWHWLERFVRHCDITIFSMKEFVPRGFRSPHYIMFPAIDPLRPKNKEMSDDEAKRILRYFGVDTSRPVVAQVSRFDPWKDPVGVIKAYQLAKKQIPDLQLILMGLIQAQDDPEQEEYLNKSKEYAGDDEDVIFISDPNNLPADNDAVVNAVQSGSDVIIQKSLREGFGLVVTEAMWKGKAIIAGRVGGIKAQIDDGKTGFLVDPVNIEETAEKIVYLISNPSACQKISEAARESVRLNFLLPRMMYNHLLLFAELDKIKYEEPSSESDSDATAVHQS